jgi:hypothetical protein
MTRNSFFLSIFAVIPAWAQTRLNVDQLAAGATSPLRIMAMDSRGRLTALSVGDGIEISGTELRAVASPRVPVVLARAPNGAYSFVGGMGVFRNGVLQMQGIDYSVSVGVLTPVLPWSADDIVSAY